MRWLCLGEGVSIEKRKSKQQFRGITLNVSFFFLMSFYFLMTFECLSDFKALYFVWTTARKRIHYTLCGLCINFINLGKSTLVMIRTLTKTQSNSCLLCPVLSSYFYMMGSKPTFFLLYLKGILLKLLVRRKRWAINIPQFLTAFPFVYAFQSILNQRDNKANLFQLSICLCRDGCPAWYLQFTVS